MNLLRELIATLGLSANEILHIISTAPARYKVYDIPKRGGGTRTIAHPSRELKAIQHYVLHNTLSNYPVHECSMAYVKNRNIRTNASRHANSRSILKLDFQNFFHSIRTPDWERFAKRNPNDLVDPSEIRLYSKIMFWGQQKRSHLPRCLSIGAPTSPMLSNILLYDFDCTLADEASRAGVIYTRYADDITASGNDVDKILTYEKFVRRAVKALKTPKLTFNEEKRGLYKKGQRRLVTGLVITPDGNISVGRERKRLISAMLNRFSHEALSLETRSQLKGLLGFCVANEPDFLGRLRVKYGDQLVDAALKFHAPSRSEARTG